MKTVHSLRSLFGAAALAGMLFGGIGHANAANARHPHHNIDRHVDQGNDTGDEAIEALNAQQLQSIRATNGPALGTAPVGSPSIPSATGAYPPAATGTYAPPGTPNYAPPVTPYVPPPPGYYPATPAH
ncbi:hypothetical protein [Granulibacter bethesdensis]|nr:hypothetical protein [Granulibacter bethesdensis]